MSSNGSEVPSSGLLVGPVFDGALRVLLAGAEEERAVLSGTARVAVADLDLGFGLVVGGVVARVLLLTPGAGLEDRSAACTGWSRAILSKASAATMPPME